MIAVLAAAIALRNQTTGGVVLSCRSGEHRARPAGQPPTHETRRRCRAATPQPIRKGISMTETIATEPLATVSNIRPLSFALERFGDRDLVDWVRTQPPAVVAVVDLALVEGNEGIVAGLLPDHVAVVAEIRDALLALDDESCMDDWQWIRKHLGSGWVNASDARTLIQSECADRREFVYEKATQIGGAS